MSSIAVSLAGSQAAGPSDTGASPVQDIGEDDEFVAEWEQKRLSELRKERETLIRTSDQSITGDYREIVQDEFLPQVTSQKLVVCHFFHVEFQRCRTMDEHLRIISREHPETKFICINAEKAPFFVTKLAIQVLPTVVVFKDGVAVDRIIGFEGISTGDTFPTLALTRRLVRSGAVIPKSRKERGTQIIRGEGDDDSDDSSSGSES